VTNPFNRVAKAYVEITADYDKFRDEATTRINAAFRQVGSNLKTDAISNKIEEAGRESGHLFSKEFDNTVRNEMRAAGNTAVRVVANEVGNGNNRNVISRAFGNLGRIAAIGLATAIAGTIGGGEGLGKVFDAVKSSGSLLSAVFDSLGSGFATFLIKAGVGVIVIPHLAAVVLVLVANLVSLVGLLNILPGAFALALGALIPLVIAFQNFGDALSAVLEGDPEKIAKAMDKLAPSARSVVKEIQGLLPVFREIQKMTQGAFFGPLQGVLTEVVNNIGKQNIIQGFVNVADAWGKFLAILLRVGETPAFKQLSATLFGDSNQGGAIARTLGAIGPPLSRLLQSFADAATKSMPILEKLVGSFGGAIENFADFIDRSVQDGSFNQFLRDALQTAGDLKDVAKALLRLFFDIFAATDDGGERFLQKVTKAIDRLDVFFKSEDGKRAMEAMISLAESFAYFLELAAGALAHILDLLGRINQFLGNGSEGAQKYSSGVVTGAATKVAIFGKKYATGGVVDQPTFALVGEAGREAVVPLNDPGRAAQVMSEAGLVPLAASMSGTDMTVYVYLGTQQITDILDKRVERGIGRVARSLTRRPRM
jgi:hypothetical protein